MRSDTVLLCPAEERHAAALAGLLGELGHPATPEQVVTRLSELRHGDPDGFAVVAEAAEGAVGFAAAHLTPMLHRARPVGRVTTLVVAAGRRGQGIGGLLLAAAVAWCRERGATRLELTSGESRREAHAFYERHGWRREGVRFVLEES